MLEWLLEIPGGFWSVLSEMAPYLLFGFLAAGLLSVVISPRQVERHLGARGLWPIVKAAAFGVPLPLCSCGVIPVSASLRRHGAGKGATTAFLISTPQTGADSIMVTFSLLGGVFAVFRPLFALLTGMLGGAAVNLAERGRDDQSTPGGDPQEHVAHEARRGVFRRIITYGFETLPRDIGRALLVGLVLAAVITAVALKYKFSFATIVPAGIWQMLVLMVVGIPIYVCATASIPLAYALILAGVSPGAAFAFLMTGPATNAATLATIWKVMGKRTTFIYLGTMIVGALAGGMLLDGFVTGEQITAGKHAGWMLPPIVKHVSAVVLLVILISAVVRPTAHRLLYKKKEIAHAMKLKITGMTCSHCQASVRRALLACPGVAEVQVDLDRGLAGVSGEKADAAALRQAVEELGYGVESVTQEEDRQ